ncbi:MAG: transposase [Candidatus Diapherotrites archaeon]|uniref:Transposase n=1 Tax=Candidatus Iainarchaeum sp. TaxID=3101447 RepID=A0A8T4L3I8_9ARCH|nr:transposase [Candidatus Diapherotrites archaeon]
MMAYKFKLYPSKQQEQALFKTFDLCRFTYNQLLEKLGKQEKINRKEIQHSLVEMKQNYPELQDVYSKTLQYECHRLFGNLRALAQLKKKGIKVGKLRFRGKDWFKTINYNQSGYELEQTGKRYGKLKLSKIGNINIRCHRIAHGAIKQITIKKTAGRWYAILITDEEYKKQKGEGQIGLDFGIINFVADNNGNRIKSPLFLKRSLKKIEKAHQDLSRKKKGSNNRKRAKQRLGKLYEKVENQRNDFLHKLSTQIVSENKLICIEDLDIKEMISKKKNRFWNRRNFLDCSWATFASMLKHKAESAGADVIEVNPKNTSKICSGCGTMQEMSLSQRTYSCDCGLEIDRDVNSAKNILAQGLGFVENETASSSMKQEAITSNNV